MAITLGGSNYGIANATSTCATSAFAVQPTAGSLIAVLVRWSGGGTVSSIADNASGNTYTAVTSYTGDSNYKLQIWYAKNIATAASFVVTATMSNSIQEDIMVVAVEWKGCDTSSPLDVYGGQMQASVGTGTDASTTGTLSSCSVDGCVVFAGSTCATIIDTWNAGTNYTELYEQTTTNSMEVHVEYRIQTTAAAATATWTQDSTPRTFVNVAASFKPASSSVTTLYLLNSTASGSNHGSLQFGGSAPSTSTTGTGWTVDTVGATNYARMAYGTERASSNFSGTAQPSGAPDNTLGDCWRSSSALTGDFATGVWTIAVPVIAVTAAAGQDGRVRVRLWKSSNADGSSATEITAGATAGTTVTDLGTGAEQVSTVTTASITGFSLANEYLFVQVAWEITGAAA